MLAARWEVDGHVSTRSRAERGPARLSNNLLDNRNCPGRVMAGTDRHVNAGHIADDNLARPQRGSPSVRQFAAKVGRKFAHGPKETDVEARIPGTRIRITRTYSARVGDG
jgi:hypothetical protein